MRRRVRGQSGGCCASHKLRKLWGRRRNDRMEGDAALHRRQVTELYQFTDRTTFSVEISRNGVTETIRTTPEHPFAIYGSDARALSQREARGHAPANMAEWAERLNLPELARQAEGEVAVLDRAQTRTSAMSWVKGILFLRIKLIGYQLPLQAGTDVPEMKFRQVQTLIIRLKFSLVGLMN